MADIGLAAQKAHGLTLAHLRLYAFRQNLADCGWSGFGWRGRGQRTFNGGSKLVWLRHTVFEMVHSLQNAPYGAKRITFTDL